MSGDDANSDSSESSHDEAARQRAASNWGAEWAGYHHAPEWRPSQPGPHASQPGDPDPFPPFERRSTDRLFDSRWCGLRRDWIQLPDGTEQDYHVFEVTNAVSVVPVLPDGRILMVWQYRYPSGRSQWEIPAGRCKPDEQPADGVRRELLEETGCEAGELIPLPGFFPTGGISAHYAHAFLALDCRKVAELNLDSAEQIEPRAFQRDEVEQRLHAGVFADAFTALSLFYGLKRLDEQA